MVYDIIETSWAVHGGAIIKDRPAIKMSPPVLAAADTLRDFLFERVYNLRQAQEESEKAREVVRFLYRYFNEHEDRLPPEYRRPGDDTPRRVADYIAGMTDQYAINKARELKKKEQ